MLTRVILVCVLTGAGGFSSQQVVTFEDSGEKWAERYITVPLGDFSFANIRDLALNHLRASGKQKLVKVAIATNGADLYEMRRGKGMFDYGYRLWADVLAERQRRRGPVAVAIRIKKDAVLKIRESNGAVREEVLCGGNPLVSMGPTGKMEIVHVAFSKVPHDRKTQLHVSLFVKTERRLTIPEAERAVQALTRRIGIRERVFTVLREDPWFIENEDFPVSDPFSSPATPPSSQEYVCVPTISCMSTNGRLSHCRYQGYQFGSCH